MRFITWIQGFQLRTFTNDLRNNCVYRARTRTSLLKDLLEVVHAHAVPYGSKCLAWRTTRSRLLKKITKDLPLEPFTVALKWDHLSDLKLTDSDFRTPASIDLLQVHAC